ncbi:MAG: hypothetical protein N3F67_02765 [Acidilobaceae archaeon]|nr:hypothetical protein [Acidilobaceae archaeon]
MYRPPSPLIITTSRRPAKRTRSLVKELAQLLGGSRLTRGKRSFKTLATEALEAGAQRVIIVSTVKGNPGLLRIYEVTPGGLRQIGTLLIVGVKLAREARREVPTGVKKPEVVGDGSELAEEVAKALREALPPASRGRQLMVKAEGDRGAARVTFFYQGRAVGPTLWLRPLKAKAQLNSSR